MTKDETKLYSTALGWKISKAYLEDFAALTDIKANYLSELVSQYGTKCYKFLYWLNECLKNRKGTNSKFVGCDLVSI
jgi:hypothetical protein